MRAVPLLLAVALLCGCKSGNPIAHTPPPSGGGGNGSALSFTGTWVGTISDNSGSLMGSGIGVGSTVFVWQLTQNGNQVTGTIGLTGGASLPPGQSAPTVSGTVSGSTMTFNTTIASSTPPAGIPGPNSTCSATATGTLTMNQSGNAMTGTYTGASSCTGSFSNGVISLTRQ